ASRGSRCHRRPAPGGRWTGKLSRWRATARRPGRDEGEPDDRHQDQEHGVHHDVPREAGQLLGDTLLAQPFLALDVLRLVEVWRIPLESLDVAYREGDDHVSDDDDGEDDGEVEPLVVAEVPVVVASERHHPSSLP